jgi:hypothetical protein
MVGGPRERPGGKSLNMVTFGKTQKGFSCHIMFLNNSSSLSLKVSNTCMCK